MNRKGDMDESDQANFANAGHAPQVPRTKTLIPPPIATFTLITNPNTQRKPVATRRRRASFHRGSSYILSAIQPRVLQVLCMSEIGQAFKVEVEVRGQTRLEDLWVGLGRTRFSKLDGDWCWRSA